MKRKELGLTHTAQRNRDRMGLIRSAHVNYELMGLLMTASWLFYPTLAPANALQCASKYTKELYAEGDVMISELAQDEDPGTCIPACKNRLSGTSRPRTMLYL